jgi:hypothetical protein
MYEVLEHITDDTDVIKSIDIITDRYYMMLDITRYHVFRISPKNIIWLVDSMVQKGTHKEAFKATY